MEIKYKRNYAVLQARKKKKANRKAAKKPVTQRLEIVVNGSRNRSGPVRAKGGMRSSGRPRAAQAKPRSMCEHAIVRRYLASLADPFNVVSKGISGTHPTHRTAVLQRRVILTVTLDSSADKGADIFIPLNSVQQPWASVATSNGSWAGASVNYSAFGNGATGNVPNGAIFRTVSAGVRITPVGSANNVGGLIYFFSSNNGAGTEDQLFYPSLASGGCRNELDQAVASAPLVVGKTATFLHASTDTWGTLNAAAASPDAIPWTANSTGQTASSFPFAAHMRLWYVGTPNTTLQLEIVQNIEYYADAHKDFSSPAVTHIAGPAVTSQAIASLSERAHVESHKGSGGVLDFLKRSVHVIEGATEVAVAGAKAAWTGKKIYDGVSAMFEAGALMA